MPDAHRDPPSGDAPGVLPDDDQPSPPSIGARIDGLPSILDLTVLGVLVTAGRWAFSRDRQVFHIAIDEPAQLAIARWLSGGVRWSLFDHSTWRPGFAVVITPIYWFADDPTTVYRSALFANAALGGLGAVVLALLVVRLTGLTGRTAVAVAAVVALVPPSLSASSYTWAEPLLTLMFLLSVWWTIRNHDRPAVSASLLAVAASVFAFTTHSRGLSLIATTTVLVLVPWLLRRRWLTAAGVAAGALALTWLSSAFCSAVYREVWDDPADTNTVGTILDRIAHPRRVLDALTGQVWYQFAGSIGVVAIGTFVMLRGCWARRAPDHLDRWPSVVLVAAILPPALVSATFMSGRTRADQYIYGRYNDALTWPLVAIGIGWLIHRARDGFRPRDTRILVAAALAIAVTTVVVDRRHGDVLSSDIGLRTMVAWLLPFVGDADAVPVLRIGGLALLGLAVLVGGAALAHLALRPTAKAGPARSRAVTVASTTVVLVVAVLGWAAVRTHSALGVRLNVWEAASAVVEVEPRIPDGEEIGVLMVRDRDDPSVTWQRQRQRYQLYEHYLPDRTFVRDRGPDDAVGPYVFAPVGNPELVEAGARIVWRDPSISIALWREPDDVPTDQA